jgi:ATP-binding cassette subfamily B protein
VNSGEILIDGQDVRKVTQESIHKNIGVVQQDVFLFPTTIYDNIKYGKIDASKEEVIEAAKKAEIYDDIMHMENGFETNVGDRGVRLSGGQKQRMSIARIFLKNPKILILDEATSALDGITEVKIQKTFDELSKGRTTIIIAHRLSTIKNADKIVIIESGEIKDTGKYNELISKSEIFAKLVASQEI